MSKRRPSAATAPTKDHWDTPRAAVLPLVPYLDLDEVISEPCAGAGVLARHLKGLGFRVGEAYDIAPRASDVDYGDATQRVPEHLSISNLPFSRPALLPILEASARWPHAGWWLLPWDVTANLYFAPFAHRISAMVPIGRVSWLQNGTNGMENFGWFRMEPDPVGAPTLHPRKKKEPA